MRNFLFGAASGALAVLLIAAAAASSPWHLPSHGVQIEPLEAGGAGQFLTMSLPQSEGLAPTVSLLAQNFTGDWDAYAKVSEPAFTKMGLKIIETKKIDAQTGTFEYAGEVNNRSLHFYAKAWCNGKQAVLATSTATQKQWPDVSAKLRACVDSLAPDAAK